MSGVILVTGASGFAGSHLVEQLGPTGNVVAWSRSAPPEGLEPLARWRDVDLLEPCAVQAAIRDARPSLVFHCAGQAHVAESWQDTARPLAANVLATHHLLEAIRLAGVRCRLLVPGSATIYAPSRHPIDERGALAPASPYAFSKLAQELLALDAAREDGLEVIVARAFNHTGARQAPSFIAPGVARQIALIERGRQEPVIRVGNLDAVRDLMDVRDTVRAYRALAQSGQPGTVYNVASGVGRTMASLVEALAARARVQVAVEPDSGRLRPRDVPVLVGDSTRLRRQTGWEPLISFERMLDDLLAYWRLRVAMES